ncbi:MAG: NAD(P)/FAD-dependent oxidoreductase [Chlamydiales bacterium]|nr:NAD(P)/FAD-dependent oxidoreductase [Chlamydiales bacterium]
MFYNFFVLLIMINCCCFASESTKVYPIAIIGSGAGGTMAAKRANLNNRDAILFTGAKREMKHSRGHWVRKVDNVPGLEKYERTLNELREETLSYIASGPFHAALTVVPESVATIKKQDDLFVITDMAGSTYQAKHVILATGIMDEQPHIGGTIDPILKFANKQFIAYCLMCDGHRCAGKKTAVIGYSEEAAKNALLLANRYSPPSMMLLANGITPTISPETLELLAQKNIELVKEPIVEILGNAKERIFNGFTTQSGQPLDVEIGFVNLGIRPNNQLALMLGAQVDEKGLVITDASGETNVKNLFVIGDLRSNSMKQINTAWQHALDAMQAIDKRVRQQQ